MRRVQDVDVVELMRRDPDVGLAMVYERYADRIYDYCRSILRDDADAADVAQDTFLAASARIEQLRNPERLRPWLYAIARNRSYRTIRDRERQRPTEHLEDAMSAAEPIDARRVEAEEAKALVWEAAGGLEDRDRDVLDLHLRHGLDGADLAAVLGVTAPQANQALHRMRERLNRSVGVALAVRHGRSDCDELRAIVGGDKLSPLLRKRVARHLDACAVCEHHRRDGAIAFATIPMVPAPDVLGPALLEAAKGGAAEQAASATDWDESGFPRSGESAGGLVDPPAEAIVPRPLTQQAPVQVGRTTPRSLRRPAALAGGAAAAVVVLLIGWILTAGRLGDDGFVDIVLGDVTTNPVESTDVDAETTGSTTTVTTTSSATSQTSTTVPPRTPPAPPTSATSTTGPPPSTTLLPTVTFSNDQVAPTMALAVKCGNEMLITATISDNTDPAATGQLEVSWPPGRTKALSAAPAAPVYNVFLDGADLSNLGGTVNFVVSGRISDAAGNLSDVAEIVSCLFIE